MSTARIERDLPAILDELYLGPTPDYRDEVLAVAVRRRQRPSWTFPGRWLPMLDVAVRPVAMTRPVLRPLVVVIVLIALLLAVLAYAGSQPRLPAPFGPARNGLVTWALDGDIYVGDPATGVVQRIVAGEDIDRNPQFSRDGTHLAFLRQVPTQTGKFDLVVTKPDGTGATTLSDVPVRIPEAVEWAPDGRSILVDDADARITRYYLDGSASKVLLEHAHLQPDAFRPPKGDQILYTRDDDIGALYVMGLDGSNPHELFGPRTTPCACSLAGPARWSPNGAMVAFAVNPDGLQQRLFVVNADGSSLRQVANADGVWAENDPAWSPDSERIAFNRWQRSDAGDWVVKAIGIVSVHGGPIRPVGVAPAAEGALIEWSPDGKSILSLPGTLVEAFTWSPNANGTVARPVVIDLDTGGSHLLDWSVGSIASWQRLGS